MGSVLDYPQRNVTVSEGELSSTVMQVAASFPKMAVRLHQSARSHITSQPATADLGSGIRSQRP